ncbi:tRNA (guanosine(37)-N1)-methyltransferase TrmD [Myceligenerans cantabricum]
MRIDVVTIFPDYLAALDLSLVGKARRRGLLDLRVHDLRDWTEDRHRTVDDTPFGGGAGMVMRPDVWGRAVDDALGPDPVPPAEPAGASAAGRILVLPTPSGEVFTQRHAEELATAGHLVFACGRYEGIDARVAEHYRTAGVDVRELSIGDYVLNGGEVAALVMIEAVGRLVPGMVGNPESLVEESHGAAGLLEYPVYTKPPEWRELGIPEVLLSGHHARIDRWRRDEALHRTARRRPDMLAALDGADLDKHDVALLAELGWTLDDDGRVAPAPSRADDPAG